MQTKRMLLLAGMALGAITLTAPAAQAQTHGLTENGVFITAGSGVTMTSTSMQTTSALGIQTCEKVTLHFEVQTNVDEHLVLSPSPGASGAATFTNCTLHTGSGTGPTHPIDVLSASVQSVTFNTWGTGTIEVLYTQKITLSGGGTITCTWSGKLHAQVTNGTSTVTVNPSALNGGLCGSATVAGTGTIETSNGTALISDIKAT